jgi:peptidyl-tRNA hydrolase, PTH1 family
VKLVCGLGNPGARYARTRHNAGFMAVEAFGSPLSASFGERWQARTARVSPGGEDVLLLEPLTFMNRSGLAVVAAARFFRIEPIDVLVVHDDVDLPPGRVQVKLGGGDGGHKGIRSIIEQLGTREFPRIRVGVGRPEGAEPDMVDHVLSPFSAEELLVFDEALKQAVEGIRDWVVGGVPMAQNRVNRRVRPVKPSCPGDESAPGPQDRKEVE